LKAEVFNNKILKTGSRDILKPRLKSQELQAYKIL